MTTDRQNIGPYRIVGELGRGGMGIVYQAFDPAIGRPLAVKTIRIEPGLTPDENAELRRRFQREASAAGKLSHPGIVTVYQLGEDGPDLFIAMEFISGGTLHQRLCQTSRMEIRETARILGQVAAALDYAHQAGIVHRDVKPQNILIREDGCVKIADFGIAKIAEAATRGVTRTGVSLGSPTWMSPEQVRGEKLDGRSDQFSLAVVAFQMLIGELPFDGESPHAVMFQIASMDPFTLRADAAAAVSPATRAVFSRALAKNPSERYPSCSAFVEALAAGGEALAATSTAASQATTISAPPPAPAAAQASTVTMPTATAPPRKRSPLVLVLVIAVIVVAAAAIFAARKMGPRSTANSAATQPQTRPLVQAIAEARLDDARKLIAGGEDVNGANPDGTTPLMQAAAGSAYLSNNVPAVTLLLDRGARVDLQDKDGRSALYRATVEKKDEAVGLLLAHHADPNQKTNDGSTPLLAAILYGHLATATFLLDHGASVNLADAHGTTPLMLASEGTASMPNNAPFVRLLLDRHPPVDSADDQGRTALFRASGEGKIDAARLLLDAGANVNTKNNSGVTPLLAAVTYGKLPMVDLLIDHHAEVESADANGNTPLLVASEGTAYLPNNAPLVTTLIAAHAKVDQQDGQGRTPLFRAAAEGKEDAMRILLEHGAEVNSKSSSGATSLIATVMYGKIGATGLLLEHRADPNLADATGTTPLMVAAEGGPYIHSPADFINLLLAHGARTGLTDNQGRTALVRATQNKNTAAVALLQNR